MVHHYETDIPAISGGSSLVLLGYPTQVDSQEDILNRFSFLPSSRIWLCGYYLSPKERFSWKEKGGRWLIASEESAERVISLHKDQESEEEEAHTIILTRDRPHLALTGLALPKPPIAEVIGYRYYFDKSGRWLTESEKPLFSLQVTANDVRCHVLSSGMKIGKQKFRIGQGFSLIQSCTIETEQYSLQYTAVFGNKFWGYIEGVIECSLLIQAGEVLELGREFQVTGFGLRKSKRQNNLIWSSTKQGQALRNKGFTLERGLVGRRQLTIKVAGTGFSLQQLHEYCPSYIIESNNLFSLSKGSIKFLKAEQKLVLGTNLFSILYQ